MDQKVDRAAADASSIRSMGAAARAASRLIARADTAAKDRALAAMAAEIRKQSAKILAANAADLEGAKQGGRDAAFLDRLALGAKAVEQMAAGIEQVAALEDPVGKISERVKRPTGIEVARMRGPLGVVGIIYESRPNVTADAAALCVKAGNACILRGGSESLGSNRAIASCVRAGLKAAGLPEAAPLRDSPRSLVLRLRREPQVGHPHFPRRPAREQANRPRGETSTSGLRQQPVANRSGRLVRLAHVEPHQAEARPVALADRQRGRPARPSLPVQGNHVGRRALRLPNPADDVGVMDTRVDGREVTQLRWPQQHAAIGERRIRCEGWGHRRRESTLAPTLT